MHLCKTLLIAICFIAATSAANIDCYIFAGGRLFNLCPLKDAMTTRFDVIPYLDGIDITFSLVEQNTPSCNGTANAWVKVTYPDRPDCSDFTENLRTPTYSLTKQSIDLHILKITYQLSDNESDRLEVNLYCNPKGKKNNKIDFFVNSLESGVLTFSGYSYYGCPVPA